MLQRARIEKLNFQNFHVISKISAKSRKTLTIRTMKKNYKTIQKPSSKMNGTSTKFPRAKPTTFQ